MWNLFSVDNKYTRTTPWGRFGVFIINFEQIAYFFFLVFQFLTLNK